MLSKYVVNKCINHKISISVFGECLLKYRVAMAVLYSNTVNYHTKDRSVFKHNLPSDLVTLLSIRD